MTIVSGICVKTSIQWVTSKDLFHFSFLQRNPAHYGLMYLCLSRLAPINQFYMHDKASFMITRLIDMRKGSYQST